MENNSNRFSVLNSINSPSDLKKLSDAELELLADLGIEVDLYALVEIETRSGPHALLEGRVVDFIVLDTDADHGLPLEAHGDVVASEDGGESVVVNLPLAVEQGVLTLLGILGRCAAVGISRLALFGEPVIHH